MQEVLRNNSRRRNNSAKCLYIGDKNGRIYHSLYDIFRHARPRHDGGALSNCKMLPASHAAQPPPACRKPGGMLLFNKKFL